AYRDRVVLVTGAGGSIGSELSRKLVRLPISRLLLLDIDETAIFELERDLEDCSSERVAMVGDVRDRDFVKHIFEQHRPQIVLHAAAYKHVPLMEANASAAILNNVIATRNLVDAAIDAGCERFLLISTDKAVKPASIMGATKRIAELVIQARAAEHPETKFACVRFGNILGSRGSVVPLFLRQIQERRPVTITDPRMERYFMSGAQAADFALLACTLGKSGEIYVFETDKSIRIVDLACKLAEASGLTANHKIEFSFTGIRPGEKLQESFWEDDSVVSPTRFPGISALGSSEILEDLENKISKLEQLALKQQNDAIRAELQTLPIRYTPAHRSPMT